MEEHFGIMRAPSALLFGSGQRHALGKVVSRLGKRALICTDRRFAASAHMDQLRASLVNNGLSVRIFDGTLPELPPTSIAACVGATEGFDPDVVVGVGGGSCMDMAKLASLLLSHGGPLDRYYGELKVPGPIKPVVALPTTSGTGSEVTPVAVLGCEGRDLKVGISSPFLVPHTAICDPELTIGCPPQLTALSGADALTHAIEAFTAVERPRDPNLSQQRVFVGKNIFSDHHALTAIRVIFKYIKRAVEDGTDSEARAMMMYGSLSAGLAFAAAGTAAAHAIQYPVGALTHTPHGLGVATLLPYVMTFNACVRVSELCQIGKSMDVEGSDQIAMADETIERIRGLLATLAIPRTLQELGVPASKLDWVTEQSLSSVRLIDNNPRKLGFEEVAQIVSNAFHGVT